MCLVSVLCEIVKSIVVVVNYFSGFQETVGPTKESAVWVDETISVGPRPLSMATCQQEDPLQISVEGNEYEIQSYVRLNL